MARRREISAPVEVGVARRGLDVAVYGDSALRNTRLDREDDSTPWEEISRNPGINCFLVLSDSGSSVVVSRRARNNRRRGLEHFDDPARALPLT